MSDLESAREKGLFRKTELITKRIDENIEVLFKMEYNQPSGSFKDRGIGHMISTLVSEGRVDLLVCSSGILSSFSFNFRISIHYLSI